ncbi:hypothetical protein [Anaerolentibacter hominis]|uniref:hypothetical protein n=1 Tax=Anaerolentibacter hominis TaxID=3079009 RepID=UPI0031B7ECC9
MSIKIGKNTVSGSTSSPIDKQHWNEAYEKSHEHANKDVIDLITQEKIDSWDEEKTAIVKLNSYQEWEDMQAAGTLQDGIYYATPESESTSLIDDSVESNITAYSSRKTKELIDTAKSSTDSSIAEINQKLGYLGSTTKFIKNCTVAIDATTLSYQISDDWITADTCALITYSSNSTKPASASGLSAATAIGFLIFTAKKVPEGTITCDIVLIKEVENASV